MIKENIIVIQGMGNRMKVLDINSDRDNMLFLSLEDLNDIDKYCINKI